MDIIKLPDREIIIRKALRKDGKEKYIAYFRSEPKVKGHGKFPVSAIKSLVAKTVTHQVAAFERLLQQNMEE